MKREGLMEYVNRVTSTETDWSTLNQKELATRLVEASVYLNEVARRPVANWIIGTSNKGHKNNPIFIDSIANLERIFGNPDMSMSVYIDPAIESESKIKRIINENDPYGEENWDK